MRLKIEQAGFRTIERSITVEPGKAMEVNLELLKEANVAGAAQVAPQRRPASVKAPEAEEISEESDDEAEE